MIREAQVPLPFLKWNPTSSCTTDTRAPDYSRWVSMQQAGERAKQQFWMCDGCRSANGHEDANGIVRESWQGGWFASGTHYPDKRCGVAGAGWVVCNLVGFEDKGYWRRSCEEKSKDEGLRDRHRGLSLQLAKMNSGNMAMK